MEEVSEEGEKKPGGNLLFQCQNCQGHLCNACDDDRQSCCTCSRILCKLCDEEVCDCTDITVRTECRVLIEQCKRCAHFRRVSDYEPLFFVVVLITLQLCDTDYGFFEFGSSGEMTYHNLY
jgi:hypothetical protein